MTGIYKITSPTGRVYIGQSIDILKRWVYYKKRWSKFQRRLRHSFNKYGVENHVFEVLEECEVELLNDRERHWQDFYDVLDQHKGLNSRLTSTSDKSGVVSDETKDRIRKTFELRGTVVGDNNGMFGKSHKESSKIKMSEKAKLRIVSESTRMKKSIQSTGHKNNRAKKVINIDTKEVYPCAKYVAEILNIPAWVLHKKLNGRSINDTRYLYL